MKLVILNENGEEMGEYSLNGSMWELVGDVHTCQDQVMINVEYAGTPTAIELRRDNGDFIMQSPFTSPMSVAEVGSSLVMNRLTLTQNAALHTRKLIAKPGFV